MNFNIDNRFLEIFNERFNTAVTLKDVREVNSVRKEERDNCPILKKKRAKRQAEYEMFVRNGLA